MTRKRLRLFVFLFLVGPVSFLYSACNKSAGGGGGAACSAPVDQSTADFSGTTSVASLGVTAGTTKTVAGGSVITVTGDETIDGTLEILPGGATLIFQGALTWNGALNGSNTDTSCAAALQTKDATTTTDKEPDDIVVVLQKNATFASTFQLKTNTSVKVTDDAATLPTNDATDTAATTDDGTGNVLVPLPALTTGGAAWTIESVQTDAAKTKSLVVGNQWIFNGNFVFNTPPRGTRRIIVAIQPAGTTSVTLTNLTITGPDGLAGEVQTTTGTCTGNDGGDAMTFFANIDGDLTIDDFTITLGTGGNGGDCTANGDPDATATGGNGGQSAKIKMRTTGAFDITSFTINPGRGGQGGAATANGKDGVDGCPPKPGGSATATAGKGADNKRNLTVRNVTGVGNVTIGDLSAGDGGVATANAGLGGDNTCDCHTPGDGEDGGSATATGGKGGDASLVSSGATTGAVTGGNGGDASANSGIGGHGTDCFDDPGGDGGTGGDMTATGGKGGTGTTSPGTDGKGTLGTNAGKGGDGGEGLPPGIGGNGGTCNQDGSSSPCPRGSP